MGTSSQGAQWALALKGHKGRLLSRGTRGTRGTSSQGAQGAKWALALKGHNGY